MFWIFSLRTLILYKIIFKCHKLCIELFSPVHWREQLQCELNHWSWSILLAKNIILCFVKLPCIALYCCAKNGVQRIPVCLVKLPWNLNLEEVRAARILCLYLLTTPIRHSLSGNQLAYALFCPAPRIFTLAPPRASLVHRLTKLWSSKEEEASPLPPILLVGADPNPILTFLMMKLLVQVCCQPALMQNSLNI